MLTFTNDTFSARAAADALHTRTSGIPATSSAEATDSPSAARYVITRVAASNVNVPGCSRPGSAMFCTAYRLFDPKSVEAVHVVVSTPAAGSQLVTGDTDVVHVWYSRTYAPRS